MSEYRSIFGEAVKSQSSNTGTIEGQIWYDSAAGSFKLEAATTAGAWSSGTALPGVRWNTSGTGTVTAGLVFGGSTGPATGTFLNTSSEYDGSSWTAGGTLPISSINMFGTGIQTASIGGGGLASPGSNTTTALTYDGSSWSGITATPFATKGAGAAGTSTAALIYGSDISPSDNQSTKLWNGSAWGSEGNLRSLAGRVKVTFEATVAGACNATYSPPVESNNLKSP